MTAGGGKVRHDEDYMAATSIRVAPTSWVGTVPTTLWVDGGVVDHPTDGRLRTVRASGFAPEAFRPGTRWAVAPAFHGRTWAIPQTPARGRS